MSSVVIINIAVIGSAQIASKIMQNWTQNTDNNYCKALYNLQFTEWL